MKTREEIQDDVHEIISECSHVIDAPMPFKAVADYVIDAIQEERARAGKLVKALEFYADAGNSVNGRFRVDDIEPKKMIEGKIIWHVDDPPKETIEYCGGKRARQALQEYRGDK